MCVSGLGCAMGVLQGIDSGYVRTRFRAKGLNHHPKNIEG